MSTNATVTVGNQKATLPILVGQSNFRRWYKAWHIALRGAKLWSVVCEGENKESLPVTGENEEMDKFKLRLEDYDDQNDAAHSASLSESTRRMRKEWAEAHILWTGETWVKDEKHSRAWVTSTTSQEYDLDCVREKSKCKAGWMFWGSFAGSEKGPCLFWEKELGNIDSEGYCQKIVPLIHGMVSLRPGPSVMQDIAPAHTSAKTMEDLRERHIRPIFRPANSPDLNPIEAVWDMIKDYIHLNYPSFGGGKQRSQESLRQFVKEAWDSVSPEDLVRLLESMLSRSQAVIDADGGPTKY